VQLQAGEDDIDDEGSAEPDSSLDSETLGSEQDSGIGSKRRQHFLQRGLREHVIIYPQRPGAIAKILPPNIDEVTSPVCVLFMGAAKPTAEWLQKNSKPLTVRACKMYFLILSYS